MKSSGALLPVEILYQILYFLDPLDVVRLRGVSRQFREITYDLAIWNTLYATARLPRPPGPFPHQSASFLERTLVRSARLAEVWTTQRIQDTGIVKISLETTSSLALRREPCRMIAGRWLIGRKSFKQFVLHDIESPTSPPKVLCEFEGGVFRWDAAFVMSPKGELVYVVFAERGMRLLHTPWKLLEFRLNIDSGELYDRVSLDVPTWNFGEPGVECSVYS